ncbi:MAG: hypothetical protein IJX16_02740, partial [Clostridia bacterium]|nr:hypothetical protein [Clostridia bacterium]
GSSSSDWTNPTLTTWGQGSVYGGFIGETENYLYFINGVATSTDDNSFGAPVKGALMVQDKSDMEKAPQVVVPKLFASSDYDAGVYIYGGRAYYGTPCTDKNSSGNIANDEMTFASTKLDGTDTRTYFTVGALSVNFRILENDGSVYIVYYDTEDTALYSYNTTTGEKIEIAKTDAKAEGEEAISLASFKFLDKDAIEEGFAVAYTVTIYDEEYYESAAKEEGYSRATKNYNEVYVYGVNGETVESKKILDGKNEELTYALHYVKGTGVYATATDTSSNVDNLLCDVEDGSIVEVKYMDIISDDSLILEDGYVITLTEGVFKLRNALINDNALQEIIAIDENAGSLLHYDEEDGYIYYFNSGNTLCRMEIRNEDAVRVAVSEDIVSSAWYYPQFMELDGTKYVFYADSSTKGGSYVKYVNLDSEHVSEDTDDDGEEDKFYLDGQKFLAKRLDKDVAAEVTSVINDIMNDIDSSGAFEFVEKDGALTVESVTEAKAFLDAQTDSVKELVSDSAKNVLNNYLEAIEWANKYDTLKDAKNMNNLTPDEYEALYDAYTAVKGQIEEFKLSENYTDIRTLLGNELNAHYQKCVEEFETEEN